MRPTIVSTFDPENIPYKKHALMFQKLFEILRKKTTIIILPPLNMKNIEKSLQLYKETMKNAQMIFHSTCLLISQFHKTEQCTLWTEAMLRARGFCSGQEHYCGNQQEDSCLHEINGFLSSLSCPLINADIFFQNENELYAFLEQHNIPITKRFSYTECEEKDFPIVLKQQNTTKAAGVFLIENKQQLLKLFPNYFYWKMKEHLYTISAFVESPSSYYTCYRVYTVGNGHILAAVLCYSGIKKEENRNQIASNRSLGGKQIPLNPNTKARAITKEEERILHHHGIEKQEIPAKLVEYATSAAKILSPKGLFILGQDWIQDNNGNFFCLEINWGPELGSIDVVYNQGKGDDDATREIAAEKIAPSILEDLTNSLILFQ